MQNLKVLVAGLAAFALAAVSAPGTAYADHHHASRDPSLLDFGQGDYVYNYDFREQWTQSRYKIDWPVTFIAYNNASINRFKSVMDQFNYKIGGGTKWAWLTDGPQSNNNFIQDADGGRKMQFCPGENEQTPHYRVYADGNDYLWQMGRGAYIVGSTHRDVAECDSTKQFKDTEKVEGGIVTNLGTLYTVYHDRFAWNNYEFSAQGTHIIDSDGKGSYVDMP